MNPQEHELMVLMFARLIQAMSTLSDALKREGIWTGADEQAFRAVAQLDDRRILECAALALTEYLKCAKTVGVLTGLGEPPAGPPSSKPSPGKK